MSSQNPSPHSRSMVMSPHSLQSLPLRSPTAHKHLSSSTAQKHTSPSTVLRKNTGSPRKLVHNKLFQNEVSRKPHHKVIRPFSSTLPPRPTPVPKSAPTPSTNLQSPPFLSASSEASSSTGPSSSNTNPILPVPTSPQDTADSASPQDTASLAKDLGDSGSFVIATPLVFPADVSGSECTPSTGSEVRDRCRELIVKALKKGLNEGMALASNF